MEQIYSIIEPRIKIRMSQYHQKNTYAFGYIYGSVNRTVSRLCFLFFASYLCADFISAYK